MCVKVKQRQVPSVFDEDHNSASAERDSFAVVGSLLEVFPTSGSLDPVLEASAVRGLATVPQQQVLEAMSF